uniref:Uncharacterized protein n=1 Tax=Ditylenchus dipsaci TaxID=166011 RepID=A0A915D7L1_9BILA
MPSHSRTEVIREGAGGGTASPQPGCTTPTNSQGAPNSHSSPRPTPSILRGSSAVRRFADKEAPSPGPIASSGLDNSMTPSSFATTMAGTSGNVGPSSSSGDENSCGRQDDSPRKRQRKQQFDNSQQDKLMMEVHADPRLDQLSAENPTGWKTADGTLPGSSTQPSTVKLTGYQSSGELSTGMALSGSTDHLTRGKPRRRGRPRSINNRLDSMLPSSNLSSFSCTLNNNDTSNNMTTSSNSQPLTQTSTSMLSFNQPQGQQTAAATGAAAANSLLATRSSSWVDVDSMLQVDSGNKRPRKYKKRAPEMNPETGEPIKKQRKKGSGRKSKKDLLTMESNVKSVYSSFDSSMPRVSMLQFAAAIHNQQIQAQQNASTSLSGTVQKETKQPQNLSVSIFSQLGLDERGVVSTLCKFKSHRGAPTTPSAGLATEKETVKEPSRQSSIVEEEDGPTTSTKSGDSKTKKSSATRLNNSLDLRKFANYYDELSTFIETCKPLSRHSIRRPIPINRTSSNNHSKNSELRCEVFESFEEFKNAQECLRLLPMACSYFQNSKKLLNSLRSNLLSYSLFQQANSHISSMPTCAKVDPSSVKPISELKIVSNSDNLQKFANNFSSPLKREHNPNVLGAETELLLEMDVSTAVEGLMDAVECETFGVPSTSSSATNCEPDLCDDTSAELDSSITLSSLLQKLPQHYHSIVSSTSSPPKLRSGSKKLGRRKHESISLPSHEFPQVLSDEQHKKGKKSEEEKDGPAKKFTDNKRAGVLLQTLRESNENSQKRYRSLKKIAMKLLSRLEPLRYQEVFSNADCQRKHDLETSFLMDLPKYKPSFQPVLAYNPARSITLRPTKQLMEKLFKGKHPYCKQSQSVASSINTQDNSSTKLKSAAVDRMREKEASYMVLEELNEIEENTTHIAHFSMDRLQRKYSSHHTDFSNNISGLAKISSFGGSSDALSDIKDCVHIDRSLKRTVPIYGSTDMQRNYIEERCRETHELMATALTLAHSSHHHNPTTNDDYEETGSFSGSLLDIHDDSNPIAVKKTMQHLAGHTAMDSRNGKENSLNIYPCDPPVQRFKLQANKLSLLPKSSRKVACLGHCSTFMYKKAFKRNSTYQLFTLF